MQQRLRCCNTACRGKQPRLCSPATAFTPLHGATSAGMDPDYAMLVRASYALGTEMPNDVALHAIRREGQSLKSAGIL
eukprot:10197550-Karenia_brevis.AAC.1